MSITKQSYKDLKEYWDFQRKIEYNKERLRALTKKWKAESIVSSVC